MTENSKRVELRFNGNTLSKGLFTTINPQIFVYFKDIGSSEYKYIGCTEQFLDQPTPYFQKPIFIEYQQGKGQSFRITVTSTDKELNQDCQLANLKEKEILAKSDEILVDNVFTTESKNRKALIAKNHDGKESFEFLTRTYENHPTGGKMISFKVKCTGLDKKDLFGKSDPYFFLSKEYAEHDSPTVYKSPVIKNTLDPIYPDLISLKLEDFNGGDNQRTINCKVYDWNSNGTAHTIGSFSTTTEELINGKREFKIICDKKKKSDSKYSDSGIFFFLDLEVK